MRFSKSIIPVGNGRITSAKNENGVIYMLIKDNGAIVKKSYDSIKKSLSRSEKVSYADECYFLGGGKVEVFCGKMSYAT